MDRPIPLRGGLLYGLAAYGFWGLMPLYFNACIEANLPGDEILAHRIVWCALLLACLLSLGGRWSDLRRALSTPRTFWLLALTSVLLAGNWYAYILGASTNRLLHASLGYYITPLASVLLGMFVLGERLRLLQWLAVGMAVAGLICHIAVLRELPWIAVVIAGSFSIYGLVRKVTPVDGLIGLMIETLLLAPFALAVLILWAMRGTGRFGPNWGVDGLLMLSGVCTAIPLLCFGQAARRLPLSILGFMQYLSPTIQSLLAVNLYGEKFGEEQWISFGLIWTALVIFSVDSLRTQRK